MTPEQEKMLDELLEKGTVTRHITVMQGKLTATLVSITTGDELEAEYLTKASDSISAHQLHTYSVKILARALKEVKHGGKTTKFENAEDAETYIKSKPPVLLNALLTEQSKFEKDIRAALSVEQLENFSAPPATEIVSK